MTSPIKFSSIQTVLHVHERIEHVTTSYYAFKIYIQQFIVNILK